MGQFALGIRSLLVKATIFVVMAALLAWALGGTLFPKPQSADFIEQRVQYDDSRWHWRVLVSGQKREGSVRWSLVREDFTSKIMGVVETDYLEVAGPVVGDDGGLYYAGRKAGSKTWEIVRRDAAGQSQAFPMPDRLAAEQQLGRIEAGMSLQDSATIQQQRFRVLDPMGDPADVPRREPPPG